MSKQGNKNKLTDKNKIIIIIIIIIK